MSTFRRGNCSNLCVTKLLLTSSSSITNVFNGLYIYIYIYIYKVGRKVGYLRFRFDFQVDKMLKYCRSVVSETPNLNLIFRQHHINHLGFLSHLCSLETNTSRIRSDVQKRKKNITVVVNAFQRPINEKRRRYLCKNNNTEQRDVCFLARSDLLWKQSTVTKPQKRKNDSKYTESNNQWTSKKNRIKWNDLKDRELSFV